MIINTVEELSRAVQDSWSIRNAALQGRITYYTTVAGARAACMGMRLGQSSDVYELQALHRELKI
ncbi:Carbamoyl-phosphate synthase, large subunit, glutamine-dependent [mine drainage metagenome]|uniref:Carbamoyl-phosphate synthase, large subunit, glutamine-dependent n=1 Tax=mine drainage metagenome TaxID=410659 RepID=T1A048_9ZZZZ